MVHVNTERLLAEVSGQVSAIDGIPYTTYQNQVSAFLGTFAEFMYKQTNCIYTPSAVMALGSDSTTGEIAFQGGVSVYGSATVAGVLQGWHFALSAASTGSAILCAAVATTSLTTRKVLCTLAFSSLVLPVASSIEIDEVILQFVYGSDFATSSMAASTGGVSAIYNQIPLPKPSAGEIPVGWINVPNSHADGSDVTLEMLITDWREIQGYNMSAILGTVQQP